MLGRHEIREAAFKALFALNANPEADREAVYADALPQDIETPAYMIELVDGVLAHQAELDAAISGKLKAGWRLERLTKPDLIMLRLGLYEIQYEALPDKVAINEAIELAKKYSDEQAAKFINGILAHFVKPDQN
ncbi:transcription antitermination factor NusB [Lacticaseibacillus baoqingensis]|uniref:Transcription antitermination protein NusB n=1 Tax=Lacticaseibacillus baoqingensis TaxID=2486013 RepID=A0ABW4E384_9LACO|nr:transcription antitermination factor NusB [Lacticaseibacillus baoqingensis]